MGGRKAIVLGLKMSRRPKVRRKGILLDLRMLEMLKVRRKV